MSLDRFPNFTLSVPLNQLNLFAMNYIVEKELRNFEFWSGAKDNAAMLTTEELDKLDQILSQELDLKPLTETEINDLFRFDFEQICDLLGYQYDIDKDIIVREPF